MYANTRCSLIFFAAKMSLKMQALLTQANFIWPSTCTSGASHRSMGTTGAETLLLHRLLICDCPAACLSDQLISRHCSKGCSPTLYFPFRWLCWLLLHVCHTVSSLICSTAAALTLLTISGWPDQRHKVCGSHAGWGQYDKLPSYICLPFTQTQQGRVLGG